VVIVVLVETVVLLDDVVVLEGGRLLEVEIAGRNIRELLEQQSVGSTDPQQKEPSVLHIVN
jgi:hypothetical protein